MYVDVQTYSIYYNKTSMYASSIYISIPVRSVPLVGTSEYTDKSFVCSIG